MRLTTVRLRRLEIQEVPAVPEGTAEVLSVPGTAEVPAAAPAPVRIPEPAVQEAVLTILDPGTVLLHRRL